MNKIWQLRVDNHDGETIGWLGSNGVSEKLDEHTYRWPSHIWDIKETIEFVNIEGKTETKLMVLAVVLLHRMENSLPDHIQGNLVWTSEDGA